MSINVNEIRKLEKLSMLKLDEEQEKNIMMKLDSVIEWISILDNRDIKDVKPLEGVAVNNLTMHEDKEEKENSLQEVLSNASNIDKNMFVLPKIVE